jgi:NAD(P)-dependent dehydrogenase (short-subunit alcohol dehydrogenase family)
VGLPKHVCQNPIRLAYAETQLFEKRLKPCRGEICVIITISSVAAWERYPNVAYKATKAGLIAFTQQVAIQNAEFGVRANVILPGLIDTPGHRTRFFSSRSIQTALP